MRLPSLSAIFIIVFFVFHLDGQAKTKLKLFILAGQSNMAGMGNNEELPPALKQPQSTIKTYVCLEAASNGWDVLKPGWGLYNGCGCELAFGRNIALANPSDSFAIIKAAREATSLDIDWRPPSSGGSIGQLYTEFVYNLHHAVDLLGSGYDIEFAGMCWLQGESDAMALDYSNVYKSNIVNFVADVRKELNAPAMPFIIAMIDSQPTWQYNAIVRAAERDAAVVISNTAIFDTRGFGTNGMHYTTAGLDRIGAEFALAAQKFFSTAGTRNNASLTKAMTSAARTPPIRDRLFKLSGRVVPEYGGGRKGVYIHERQLFFEEKHHGQ
jgi:hypothetical protein